MTFRAILLALAVVFAAGTPASAQRHGRDGVQPLDRLLPGIRRAHPGQFYDAEGPTYGPGGNPHYHLKWMTPDGRIIWYDADARSGQVLRASPGRDGFDAPRGDDRSGYGPRAYGPREYAPREYAPPGRYDDRPPGDTYRGGDDGRGYGGRAYGPPDGYRGPRAGDFGRRDGGDRGFGNRGGGERRGGGDRGGNRGRGH